MMHSIIAALTWEYVARNRWMLLWLPLLANIPALCILLPLKSISPDDSFMTSPLLIGIQVTVLLSLVMVVCLGIISTQGSSRRLYRFPISTIQITSYYFWTGALLVGAQVALVLWLWKVLLPIDWPIASPVVFSIVCWCALQPVVRGQSQSLWWIVLAILIVIALSFWLLIRHGVPFQQGGMLTSQVHYWNVISITDWLITFFSIGLAYWLTAIRVTYDRSGRSNMPLLERIQLALERLEARWFSGSWNFRSPIQAYSWYDLRHRLLTIPILVFLGVLVSWVIAGLTAVIKRDPGTLIGFAIGGTYLSAVLQVYMALLFGALSLFGKYLVRFEAPEHKLKKSDATPFEHGSFFNGLPISFKDKATALVASSAMATVICGAVLLLSYALIGVVAWAFGVCLSNVKFLNHWKYLVSMNVLAMVLTFVLNNLKFSIGPMLWRIDHWFWSIILAAILVAFGQPAGICVSAAFCVFVLVALTASTIQSLMKADIRLGKALGIWGIGTSLAILGWYLFRDEFGPVGMLLLAALAGLSMLPFFSTTESIRRAHTS